MTTNNRITVTSEAELSAVFESNPGKLIGLSKGLTVTFVRVFNTWSEIPHDAYRQGIYKDGKRVTPPPGWAKRETAIKSHVGRE